MTTFRKMQSQRNKLLKQKKQDEVTTYYRNRLTEIEKQIKEEEEKFSPDFNLIRELKIKRFNLFVISKTV